jgi:hypothetical protein
MGIIGPDLTYLFHYLATVSLDIVILSILYCGVAYYLGLKSSHPVWISSILAAIVICFKMFVIDPRSGLGYLGIIENIILLAVTITAGIYANHVRIKKLNRFKSGSKVS